VLPQATAARGGQNLTALTDCPKEKILPIKIESIKIKIKTTFVTLGQQSIAQQI
jgi:hypothetical protein